MSLNAFLQIPDCGFVTSESGDGRDEEELDAQEVVWKSAWKALRLCIDAADTSASSDRAKDCGKQYIRRDQWYDLEGRRWHMDFDDRPAAGGKKPRMYFKTKWLDKDLDREEEGVEIFRRFVLVKDAELKENFGAIHFSDTLATASLPIPFSALESVLWDPKMQNRWCGYANLDPKLKVNKNFGAPAGDNLRTSQEVPHVKMVRVRHVKRMCALGYTMPLLSCLAESEDGNTLYFCEWTCLYICEETEPPVLSFLNEVTNHKDRRGLPICFLRGLIFEKGGGSNSVRAKLVQCENSAWPELDEEQWDQRTLEVSLTLNKIAYVYFQNMEHVDLSQIICRFPMSPTLGDEAPPLAPGVCLPPLHAIHSCYKFMPHTVDPRHPRLPPNSCCNKCGILAGQVKTMRCAKCKARRYCSKECQLADWPTHKRECRLYVQVFGKGSSEWTPEVVKPCHEDFQTLMESSSRKNMTEEEKAQDRAQMVSFFESMKKEGMLPEWAHFGGSCTDSRCTRCNP